MSKDRFYILSEIVNQNNIHLFFYHYFYNITLAFYSPSVLYR